MCNNCGPAVTEEETDEEPEELEVEEEPEAAEA